MKFCSSAVLLLLYSSCGYGQNNGSYAPQNGPMNYNGNAGGPLNNAPNTIPYNRQPFQNNKPIQIVRIPVSRTFRVYLEPLGVALNPLSVGPSLTVGGNVSYFFTSTLSADIMAIVPILGGSDGYSKMLFGAGLGKSFTNGAVFHLGVGYKTATELRTYDRVVDKLTEDSVTVERKSDFSNCPNPGLQDLSSGRNTVTYVNCRALISASYIGIYTSLGMQISDNENFGIHLRLFTLFYPIPFVGQSVTYDVRDKKEKGILTPRDLFDVSSLGMSVTFGF